MKPTARLRFIDRLNESDKERPIYQRILQQWWEFTHCEEGEWRDVPLEKIE